MEAGIWRSASLSTGLKIPPGCELVVGRADAGLRDTVFWWMTPSYTQWLIMVMGAPILPGGMRDWSEGLDYKRLQGWTQLASCPTPLFPSCMTLNKSHDFSNHLENRATPLLCQVTVD